MKRIITTKKKSEEKNREINNTEKLLLDIKEAIKKTKKQDLEAINRKKKN